MQAREFDIRGIPQCLRRRRIPAARDLLPGRLPAALCPTGTLLLLTELRGIGTAGLVTGMLWTGQAVGGPPIGRLADRLGHRPVILTAALANAAALFALVGAVLGGLPVSAQAGLAVVVGLTVPQIGPLARSRWIVLTEGAGPGLTGRVLSFDATIDEISFMAGPALAAAVVVLIHPAAGLVLAGGLSAVFGVLFSIHPTAPKGVGAARVTGVPLLSRPLAALLAMALLQGAIWGAANAGVSALAQHLGNTGLAGFVWGGLAVTSTLAGVATTAAPPRLSLTLRLRLAITAQALLLLPLLAVHGLLGAALAVGGLGVGVAPHLIALFGLAERVAPAVRMGEAMALLGSAMVIGQGIAALAAGPLAEHSGFRAAFALSCAAGAAACCAALVLVRERLFAVPSAAPVEGLVVTAQ